MVWKGRHILEVGAQELEGSVAVETQSQNGRGEITTP